MKRIPRTVMALALGVAAASGAQALPRSVEEFRASVAQQGKEPRQAARLFFDAVYVYLQDAALGGRLLAEIAADPNVDRPANRTFFERLKTMPHIFHSYARGTSPQNGYRIPDPSNYEIEITRVDNKPYTDRPPDEYVKVFVKSTGADSPRPITFRRMPDGVYKAHEFSSIYLGVRPPA
jgi:hypothetical protein